MRTPTGLLYWLLVAIAIIVLVILVREHVFIG